jgi:hypothetical protein
MNSQHARKELDRRERKEAKRRAKRAKVRRQQQEPADVDAKGRL